MSGFLCVICCLICITFHCAVKLSAGVLKNKCVAWFFLWRGIVGTGLLFLFPPPFKARHPVPKLHAASTLWCSPWELQPLNTREVQCFEKAVGIDGKGAYTFSSVVFSDVKCPKLPTFHICSENMGG